MRVYHIEQFTNISWTLSGDSDSTYGENCVLRIEKLNAVIENELVLVEKRFRGGHSTTRGVHQEASEQLARVVRRVWQQLLQWHRWRWRECDLMKVGQKAHSLQKLRERARVKITSIIDNECQRFQL